MYEDTNFSREKLAVTIRFLATGESFESLQYQYIIHRTTIAQFVPEVCFQVYKILKDEYLSTPCSKEEWETIARRSEERWQFPNYLYLRTTVILLNSSTEFIKTFDRDEFRYS